MTEINPQPGEWALFRTEAAYDRVGVEMKQIAKVMPATVKFVGSSYPRQCSILSIVASFADEETATRLRDSIAGVSGEFERRRRAAEAERSARIDAALTAANAKVAEIVARAHPERPLP